MKKLLSVLFLLLLTISASAATKKLFLTGGQSNTDGRLYAATLPSYLQSANANALVSYQAPYSEGRLGVFYPYFPTSDGTGQPDRWAYDFVDVYTKFGNDEVVWKETTWLCQNFGFPSRL